MLMMLLLLVQADAAEARPPVVAGRGDPTAAMRTIGLTTPRCRDQVTATAYPTTPGGGLMWRDGDDPVRLYRLLDRRVNGCSAPIVVNDRGPGSNAVGRGAGGTPRP